MPKLPTPVTVTDELLVAVHSELTGLRADLAAARGGGEPASAEPGQQVELLEPKPAKTTTSRRARSSS